MPPSHRAVQIQAHVIADLVYPFTDNPVDYINLEIALGVYNIQRWHKVIFDGDRILSHFVEKGVAAFPPDLWTWVLENAKIKKRKPVSIANSDGSKKRRVGKKAAQIGITYRIGEHEVEDTKAHFLTVLQQCATLSGKFRAQFNAVAENHRGQGPPQHVYVEKRQYRFVSRSSSYRRCTRWTSCETNREWKKWMRTRHKEVAEAWSKAADEAIAWIQSA
jgi:hypothetical protein